MDRDVGVKDVWIFFVAGVPAILILFGLVELLAGYYYNVEYRISNGYDFVTAGIIVLIVELAIYVYLRHRGRVG